MPAAKTEYDETGSAMHDSSRQCHRVFDLCGMKPTAKSRRFSANSIQVTQSGETWLTAGTPEVQGNTEFIAQLRSKWSPGGGCAAAE